MLNPERLFNPRGIAVIGASTEPRRPGGEVINMLVEQGYRGGIYPVNPKYPELFGKKCYASLADIPGDVDLAIVALSAAHVAGAVEECGRRGIPFVVAVAGGFREVGPEGAAHEARLQAAAKAGNVRVIGPNCLGLINFHDNVFAGWGSIARAPIMRPGPVSLVSNSGAFATSLMAPAHMAGIGFRNAVSCGNQCDITGSDMIEAFVADKATKIIIAYLEGISDGRHFMRAAQAALAAGKPLIVLKGGKGRQGQRTAATHTGAMTGAYDVYRAAFRQCGVIEAMDINDVVEFASSLQSGKLPKGRHVAVMGSSGGQQVNFCDAADDLGLVLAPLAEDTRKTLRENVPAIATIDNPIDFTGGFIRPATMDRYLKSLDVIFNDPNIHQLGMLCGVTTGAQLKMIAETAIATAKATDKPLMLISGMPPEMTEEGMAVARAANVPVLPSPRRMAVNMAMLCNYAEAVAKRKQLTTEHVVTRKAPALPAGGASLDEHEAKRVLAEFGIAVTHDVQMPADGKVSGLPKDMKFPVAVKIVSRDIGHKTDIGCVKLNVDQAGLAQAAQAVVDNARKAAPKAKLAGVLVSEMVTDGLETIVGVVNDPLFGPVVAFGLGGILAETLRDVTYRIAPFSEQTAREMIGELRAAAIFGGLRGAAPRDVDALAQMLSRVSEFAWLLRDRLEELDMNPVLVRPKGQGAVAADALLVLR